MSTEDRIETVLLRISLIESKISIIEDIYQKNPYNSYLLNTKNELQSSIDLLKKEIERLILESSEPINIDLIKKRVRVIEKDPFLNMKIQDSILRGGGGLVPIDYLPKHPAPIEPPINPVVE